jgi:3-methyl-2-oxobutanoate hydroxymethyltransferase
MSVQVDVRRMTVADIRVREGGTPIVALTSYHAHTAQLVDKHCDVILVGRAFPGPENVYGMRATKPDA